MNIHEYQAKQLLREYGVAIADGRVVLKADQARSAARGIEGPVWVVKPQILNESGFAVIASDDLAAAEKIVKAVRK